MPRERNTRHGKTLGKAATAKRLRERRARTAFNTMQRREGGEKRAHDVLRRRGEERGDEGSERPRAPRRPLSLAEEAARGKREAKERQMRKDAEIRAIEARQSAARKVRAGAPGAARAGGRAE